MPKPIETGRNLGKIQSIHAVAPIHVQRAAIVAILSFIFFLAMLAMFSYRQQFGYFILATAFMAVEIFTLLGFFSLRRNVLKIFERGLCYRKRCFSWDEIVSIETNPKTGISLALKDGRNLVLPATLYQLDLASQKISFAISPGV